MQSTGLTSTPTTRTLLFLFPLLSLLFSITSLKHHLTLRRVPHLYPYLQLHRLFIHQLAYTSSTDLLFSLLLLYHVARPLERLLGTRKLTSLILVAYLFHALITPLVLIAVLRPLSWGRWNYIPAGATGVLFSLLAVWEEQVPRLWKWKIVIPLPSTSAFSAAPRPGQQQQAAAAAREEWTITLSSKSPTHLLALQLSLTQFPYTIPPAIMGYVLGMAYEADLLPGGVSGWRVPGWVVGEWGAGKEKPDRERERYEGLRRRLEEERSAGDGDRDGMRQAANASATGSGMGGGGEARRRPIGAQIAEYFRGVY